MMVVQAELELILQLILMVRIIPHLLGFIPPKKMSTLPHIQMFTGAPRQVHLHASVNHVLLESLDRKDPKAVQATRE